MGSTESAPRDRDRGDAKSPEAVPTSIVRSLAAATDFGDLIRRVAGWLELDRHAEGSVRFWLFENGRAEPLIRHPPAVELPSIPGNILLSAAAGSLTDYEGADFVCLSSEEEMVGILEIRPSGSADATFLAQIAAVAAARIGGLVMAQRQRERLPHVPATDTGQEIQEVIAGFAAQAKGLLDHDRLSIYLLTPDGAALERFAVATSPVVPGEGDVMPLEQVGLTRVVKTNKPLVSADFGQDDRILGLEDSIIARAGFHGLVSVPLRMGGKPFGVLNFVSKTRNYYSELDIPVAQQIADEASVFLQNLRLQHGIRAAVEREAITRERNRVAQEFHDTLAQTLSVIASHATALTEDPNLSVSDSAEGHASVIRDLSLKALDEARRSLHDMLPSQLEDASLAEAIEQTLAQLHDEDGLATSVIVEGRIDLLPKNSQATMFRIFSEAITNVRRHAQATSVAVQLIETSSDIRMSVLDNGTGMQSTEAQSSESGGFGLETMRKRAESLGGRLTVSSAYDSGTEILLSVPASRPPAKGRLSPRRVVPHSVGVARVLMIDDHPTFREGIRQLLAQAPGVRLVGEAPTGADGFAMVVSRRPDVVLLDLDLPDCSGIELARRVRSAVPEAAVIILSAFAESDNVSDALHAGARGYVAKSVGPSTILDAINTVLNGGTLLPSSFLSNSISEQESLTPRELEILKWIALGKTNAEIGRELHLAHKTIERVVANVTRKLDAQNRAHAVAKGMARKLVDVRDVRDVRADPR